MISLESAKKLKDAGLKWEPQWGDVFNIPSVFSDGITMLMDANMIESYRRKEPEDNWPDAIFRYIWFPRLDQLLAEIEKRGWDIDLMHFAKNKGNTEISDDPSWSCEINKFLGLTQTDVEPKLIIHQPNGTDHAVNVNGQWQENRLNEIFDCDSPAEAVAQALLWILKEGKNEL